MIANQNIVTLGEVLIDFISTKSGVTLKLAPQFIKCAGGAPANVAVGIARLGTPSAFIGKVGDDSFGKFLVRELRAAGVDTTAMVYDPCHKTRLAFVSLMKNGERDFEFWEQHPADEQLQSGEVNREMLNSARILNVGSFLLIKDPSRTTALESARCAKALGRDVCFDPNLRLSLWPDKEEGRKVMTEMIRLSSIVRLNDKEAEFFTGIRRVQSAATAIRKFGPALVVVTLGAKGCYFQTDATDGFIEGFDARAVDTTGCGDGFLAGLLHGIARTGKKLDELLPEELKAICTVSNAVGALVSLKRGAIAAMPSARDLQTFLERKRKR